MAFPTATFFVSVDKKTFPFLSLFKSNFDKSGVRYELIILSEITTEYDYSELKPKLILEKSQELNGTELFYQRLNNSLANISTPNVFFISDPFLCSDNWAKKYINTKDKIQGIGVLTIAFSDSMKNLHLTHTLNNDIELTDVYTMERNVHCGLYLVPIETIQTLGAFSQMSDFKESILQYSLRALKMGLRNYVSLDLITGLLPQEEIVISEESVTDIQIPIRSFTPVEEMAYHDLDNLLFDNKINGHKFIFDFTGVFGFRCECLSHEFLIAIDSFALRFNLSFNIKSGFLSREQVLNKNVWVVFKIKG
jgi:hypothetical protein